MEIPLTALELTGTIDEHQQLRLHGLLPKGPRKVRVILLYALEAEEEMSEQDWLKAAVHNPAFAFLADPAEDIYTIADGQPFHHPA